MSPLVFLLGQASLLWGLVIAPAYWIAFALLLPQAGHAAALGLHLPTELPAVGLALGVVGWLMARSLGETTAYGAVTGVVLNATALALSTLLQLA
ncbi:MAG: hypothetical protein IRY99_04020 [Isosphaeraceae bacterium]|nr:hypothetical protein [Isosphaeraceae bacterium]